MKDSGVGTNRKWTEEEFSFLKENYLKLGLEKTSELLSRPRGTVRTYANRLGLYTSFNKKWTEEETSYLIENFPNFTSKEIADKLGTTVPKVTCKAKLLGLKKSKEHISKLAKEQWASEASRLYLSEIRKGKEPWNKGRKGFPSHPNTAKNHFKKGNVPVKTHKLGTEIVDSRGYVRVKIKEPNVWKAKHQIIWEEKNGPLPDGHRIRFKDNNNSNLSIDNLEIVTNAENMERNSMLRFPKELQEAIRTLSKAKRKIKEAIKNAKEEHM